MTSPQRVPWYRFDGTVTAEQRAFYEQYGFVVYRGVFDSSDIEVVQRDARRLERDTLDGKVPAAHRDKVIKPSYDAEGRATLHRLPYFTLHCADTRKVIEDRNLDALGSGLLGKPTWRFEDSIDGSVWQMKRGRRSSYSALDWHLDFPHDQPVTPLVNVGIYLDDATITNGCLVIVPGSHRYPPRRVQTVGLPVEVSAGDVICHTFNILHHSGPVLDDTSRATLYVYYSAGQKPAPGTEYSHRAGEDFATMITGTEVGTR